jgi:ankyrin repeat protein
LSQIGETSTLIKEMHELVIDDNVDNIKKALGKEKKSNAMMIFSDLGRLTGKTLFELAAEYCRPNILSYLLTLGVDINHRNSDGETALHICIQKKGSRKNRTKCIQILLSNANIDVNMVDEFDYTPLQQVSQSDKNNHILKILLKHEHIDVNKQLINDYGTVPTFYYSPLALACLGAQSQNVRHLVQHRNIDINLLCTSGTNEPNMTVEPIYLFIDLFDLFRH